MMVFSGFNIIPKDIPAFWRFLYYGTPIHYGKRRSAAL